MNDTLKSEIVIDDTVYETQLTQKFINRKKYVPKDKSQVCAYIPGTIRQIFVKQGQKVNKGDSLLILEAMKMKNEIKSEYSGIIKRIAIKENQLVSKNELMIELTL